MIVEDDPRLLPQLVAVVECLEGVRAIGTTNLPSARQAAWQHRPQVCLVDIELGDECGLDRIPELRAEIPDVRVIILSGRNSTMTTVAAMRAGAYDVLSKPVIPREVIARILGDLGDVACEREVPTLDRCIWEHMQRVLDQRPRDDLVSIVERSSDGSTNPRRVELRGPVGALRV